MKKKPNQTILIIEDDQQDAEFTIQALSQASEHIPYIHLSNADELKDFDYEKHGIGMIFLDIKMPRVYGLDLLKSIKSHPFAKNIPIIIFSSSSIPQEVKEAKILGIYDFIVKPINIDHYFEIVKEAYFKILKNN
ncbi:MAG: response regulator [Microscillaceae bacterium]|nr:response regulator [Microscillaceae bacterium]